MDKRYFKLLKRNDLAVLLAIIVCFAMLASGCSGSEEAAMAGETETNEVEENAMDNTEDTAAAATPGVYAEVRQYDSTIEITPLEGGITDSTVLPTFKCTFGDMTAEAQKAHEEGRTFPKEFFRDLTACMLISEAQMAGKEHDAIMYSLSTLAAMANEFWSLDPDLKNVVYETADDGSVARSIYNVRFGADDKDGQIIYDNKARQWYLGDTAYSGSLDSEETLALWWTVFDVADGNIQ